jgi:NhaP-type Na+/H+ or K+/H+ antiporter
MGYRDGVSDAEMGVDGCRGILIGCLITLIAGVAIGLAVWWVFIRTLST